MLARRNLVAHGRRRRRAAPHRYAAGGDEASSARCASIPCWIGSIASGPQALDLATPAGANPLPAPLSRPAGAGLPVSRLGGRRHPVRPHVLPAAQDQSQSGVCRPEGGRQADRRARRAVLERRPFGPRCHLCVRNDLLSKSAEIDFTELAPQAGFEPATLRLTAGCSAVELLRNVGRTLNMTRGTRHGETSW
jgi:hypothetical protein